MTTPDYDTDFYAWAAQQAAALRAKDWAALDLAHLAEEGFTLKDLMAELGRLELKALGYVKHGDVPQEDG